MGTHLASIENSAHQRGKNERIVRQKEGGRYRPWLPRGRIRRKKSARTPPTSIISGEKKGGGGGGGK